MNPSQLCSLRAPLSAVALSAVFAMGTFASDSVHAADAMGAPTLPNAGSLLREAQPNEPVAPQPDRARLQEPSPTSAVAAGPEFVVRQVQFKGNTAVSSLALQAQLEQTMGVLGDRGVRLTMGKLKEASERLSAYYRSQGYPLSRVVVPQQDITQGVLTLEVIEARVGQVVIQNQGRIATSVLERLAAPLTRGQAITESALDRALLLMSDTPGAQITATIKPGTEVGSSDIVVNNAAGPLLAGTLSLDTQGNRYTGRTRALAHVRALNPLGLGDEASLTLLTSGNGMQYERLAYQSLVGHTGTQVGGACSSLNYELGHGLQALQAHGTAKTCSTWVSQPLVRSRTWNMEARVQFDAYKLRDRVDAQQIQSDRSIDAFTATLSGDVQDSLLGGATNSWSVSASQGGLRFNNRNAALSDAASAQAAGSYTRWNWSANRLQGLGSWSDKVSLWASVNGQGAASNLDSSQKMGLGGAQSVRAYDQGAVSGDQGYQATLEVRYWLGNYQGPLQASVFYDIGHIQINHERWAAVTGSNRVTLSGAGVGLNWRGFDRFSLGLSLAAPLGVRPELVKQARTGVLWLSFSAAF